MNTSWLKGFLIFFLLSCRALSSETSFQPSFSKPIGDYYLVFLVDNQKEYGSFLKRTAFSGFSPESFSYGHAWFLLRGKDEKGEVEYLEGGHSGELGLTQARYFEGITNYINYGYAFPSEEEKQKPRYEKNPIKYLSQTLYDGFFQKGNGGHQASYARAFCIDHQQYTALKNYLKNDYAFLTYNLKDHQCCALILEMGSKIGLHLQAKQTLQLPSTLSFRKERLRLWEDSFYQSFSYLSPQKLEKSLRRLKKGKEVTRWYRQVQAKKGLLP